MKKKSKRARYQGTKCSDGRWKIVLTLTAENGGKFRKPIHPPSQLEVQRKCQEHLSGNPERRPTKDMKLSDFMLFWIKSRKPGWDDNTHRANEGPSRLY